MKRYVFVLAVSLFLASCVSSGLENRVRILEEQIQEAEFMNLAEGVGASFYPATGALTGGVLGAVVSGASALAVAVPAIRVSSSLMSNDRFVAWIAQSSKPVNPQRYAQRLAVIYNTSDEETRRDLDDFMVSVDSFMRPAEENEPVDTRSQINQLVMP